MTERRQGITGDDPRAARAARLAAALKANIARRKAAARAAAPEPEASGDGGDAQAKRAEDG